MDFSHTSGGRMREQIHCFGSARLERSGKGCRYRGYVQRQFAERHRLSMRPPIQLPFWDAIEQFAGGQRFVFDFFKESIW